MQNIPPLIKLRKRGSGLSRHLPSRERKQAILRSRLSYSCVIYSALISPLESQVHENRNTAAMISQCAPLDATLVHPAFLATTDGRPP
ncbi:unnamed protein product [Dicrocoelium dendriticum]|nr:unnamed protein product [Dicrocoelium dendriticum]